MNQDFQFLEYFKDFLKTGYDVHASLSLCETIMNYQKITKIKDGLNEGLSIQEIINEIPFQKQWVQYFNFFFQSNSLPLAIEKSLYMIKNQRKMINRLRKKLIYPLFILVFIIFFSLFLSIFLLPQLENMYTQFQYNASIINQFMMTMINIFPFLISFILIVLLFILFLINQVNNKKNYKLLYQLIQYPIFNKLWPFYYSNKFCVFYTELISQGMDIHYALDILHTQNYDYDIKNIAYMIKKSLQQGIEFEAIIKDYILFDSLFKIAFITYLKQGNNLHILEEYVTLSFKKIDEYIEKLIKITVPTVFGVAGLFIGVVYLSILMPMLSMIETI